jgi:uncharacterized protein YdhG (YjbR/CyaY superfamily)
MKSYAKNVDEYLEEVPEERLVTLKELRALCKKLLTGYEESMAYKMPSYKKNDIVEVAFASQKQHICVYILKHDVMLANNEALAGLNHGKGCIRYSNPDKIDFKLISKLLTETVESSNRIC